MKPDGWAILQVRIMMDKTFEDPNVVGSDESEKLFGQSDHLRVYGLDFENRLREVGVR